MSSFGKRLRQSREAVGMTQAAVAGLFDPPVSRNAVANWEGDGNMPDPDKLPTLARAMRKSVDWLLTGRGGHANVEAGPDFKGRVPIISWVQAGAWTEAVDNVHPGHAEEWTQTTVPIHQHTYALRVKGDSMTNPGGDPSFPQGSVIVVEPEAVDGVEKMVGSFVIVKRPTDEEATFKKLVKDGGNYFLKPLNPQYPMLELREDDVFCGVVREKVMRFF